MCGVFGFISRDGRGPDVGRLKRMAIETQLRGHHAFGLAWLDARGTLRTFKRPGAVTDDLTDLERVRDAAIVVGHCRWATHGDPADNANNHPHSAGRGFFVHNGVVANYAALIARHRLAPQTECDSEVLGLLMRRGPGGLLDRAQRTAAAAEGRLAVLGVWRDPARLLIVRNGNPLCIGETDRGLYLGSLAGELPGKPRPLKDAYTALLTLARGTLRHEARRLAQD